MKSRDRSFRDRLLVLRAQNGDRDAIDRVLRAHQEGLYRYVRGLVVDATLAQDVLQDVFVIVCRKIHHLREPQFFRAWAYRIASRRAFRVMRRERGRAGVSLEDCELAPMALAAPEPVEPLYDPALIARLPSLLAEVSTASRAVLSLHYLDEMSLQETADILEIPVGTVKSRLAYGLASIRRLMREPNRSTDRKRGASQ